MTDTACLTKTRVRFELTSLPFTYSYARICMNRKRARIFVVLSLSLSCLLTILATKIVDSASDDQLLCFRDDVDDDRPAGQLEWTAPHCSASGTASASSQIYALFSKPASFFQNVNTNVELMIFNLFSAFAQVEIVLKQKH